MALYLTTMYDWSALQRASLSLIVIAVLPVIPIKLLDMEEKYNHLLREAFDFSYFLFGTILMIATLCYIAACCGLYVERTEHAKKKKNMTQKENTPC